jgi:predicted nucleotidyltransferase
MKWNGYRKVALSDGLSKRRDRLPCQPLRSASFRLVPPSSARSFSPRRGEQMLACQGTLRGPRLAVQIASVRCLLTMMMARTSCGYGWSDCPRPVSGQVRDFVSKLSEMLGSNLVGVYLHGSLAMGCFNPHASDIDVLVITQRRVGRQKLRLASLALATSLEPRPIEVTTFSKRDLNPWRYPTPFDFHFSEDWRTAYESGTALRRMGKRGEDPAADLAETRARGVVLLGPPIESVLPTVPVLDFLDSVIGDFRWALRKLNENATIEGRMSASTYLVLRPSWVTGASCSGCAGSLPSPPTSARPR